MGCDSASVALFVPPTTSVDCSFPDVELRSAGSSFFVVSNGVSDRTGSSSPAFSFSSGVFSGVGQMPNCSYRSKKLELVGGALSDILVDLDRGRRTAPDPDLESGARLLLSELRGTTPSWCEDDEPVRGVGGSGDVGGGVIGEETEDERDWVVASLRAGGREDRLSEVVGGK